MKIAVLHWATSSVGGINTTFQTLREVALRRGDTFHILASDPQKTKKPLLLPNRKRVRGGDTFITIDGYAPHHPTNWRASARFLEDYDLIITSYVAPHPTKAYGPDPLFLPLLEALREKGKRIVGYIHDGYWETYKEFGELVLPLVEKTMVCQIAYGKPLVEAGYPVTPAFVPFTPLTADPVEEVRDPNLAVWLPQWKNIKGIRKWWKGLPDALASGLRVEMYGNGIEYYKMRKEDPDWSRLVGQDHFAPAYSGDGSAEFFGCVELEEVARVLSRAAFMFDFQGHAAKHAAYLNGSYNHTILEALYYGAVPVVHENMLKSAIPSELLLPLEDVTNWAEPVRNFDLGAYPRELAREYVNDVHSAEKLYDSIVRPVA